MQRDRARAALGERGTMNKIHHWIGGAEVVGTSGRTGRVFDPATGEQSGEVDFASVDEVDLAVATAAAAFPEWRSTSLARRSEVLFKLRELVDRYRADIARVLTSEHGKVQADALGEVARGLENIEFACGVPHLLKGGYTRAGLGWRRRLLDPPAARRRRRHHAVQLPGDGPDVDVRQCHRVWQHVRPQAEREGPFGHQLRRRAAGAGRRARGCLQHRARRQGGGRPLARAP